jgi:hypothetical protein
VALLVAYDGDRICGYIGVLPELIFLEGRAHTVGWLTTWWTRPDLKYAAIGFVLMLQACEVYQGAVGGSAPTQAASKVLDASKRFMTVSKQPELRLLVRANTREMLVRKMRYSAS